MTNVGSSAETTSVVAADLSGANEVPPTDAALVGDSFAALDTESGEICYRVLANVGPATGLHIHRGAVGVNGAVVVAFEPTRLNGEQCARVTPELGRACSLTARCRWSSSRAQARSA